MAVSFQYMTKFTTNKKKIQKKFLKKSTKTYKDYLNWTLSKFKLSAKVSERKWKSNHRLKENICNVKNGIKIV